MINMSKYFGILYFSFGALRQDVKSVTFYIEVGDGGNNFVEEADDG